MTQMTTTVATGTSVSKRELVQLGAERLAELLLDRALEERGLLEKISRILREAKDRPCAQSMHAESEDGEPYMIGNSPVMLRVYDMIRRFAATDAPVLITGESGTGKELAAQAIHERSHYASGPFIPINCGALPPSLIASELFGYEKGAFTGATQQRIGRIEAANGGTVFLDEIGDLPMELQAHLLRFLQDSTIDRVGGQQPTKVNVRVIAATNVDLATAVARGDFREDLFYRLNVLAIELPPVRGRGSDIDVLAKFFLHKFNDEMGGHIEDFDDGAIHAMRAHRWPGNVRELIACIRRAVVMANDDAITADDLGLDRLRSGNGGDALVAQEIGGDGAERSCGTRVEDADFLAASATDGLPSLEQARSVAEQALVRRALAAYGRNVKRTAEHLGVSRVTLYRLMEKHGISERSHHA